MKKYTSNLVKIVKQVSDDRRKQGLRYSAPTIIWILIIGLFLGETHLVGICSIFTHTRRLKKLVFRLSGQYLITVPNPTTITRALQKIKLPDLLKRLQPNFSFNLAKYNLIAGDGKVMNGVHDGSQRQILSLVNNSLFPVHQVELANKENEITALVKLLKNKTIKFPAKTIFTFDAIQTQVSVIKQLIKNSLDYVMKVKNNQQELKDQLKYIFNQGENDKSFPLKTNIYTRFEKQHDRFTTWKTVISNDFFANDLPNGFGSVKTIGYIETDCQRPRYQQYTGLKYYTRSKQRTFFISSIIKDAKELFNISRDHWRIEKLHWLKDSIYLEDKQTLKGKAAYFLTFLRSLAIGFIGKISPKITQTIRRFRLDYQYFNQSMKQIGII